MVAGLIAVAVANKEVIAHPHGHTSFALSLLLGGGPILFLAAQGWYLWAVPNVRSQLHVIGGVALLLVGFATLAVPPYVALFLVGASVSTLAILARYRCRRPSGEQRTSIGGFLDRIKVLREKGVARCYFLDTHRGNEYIFRVLNSR